MYYFQMLTYQEPRKTAPFPHFHQFFCLFVYLMSTKMFFSDKYQSVTYFENNSSMLLAFKRSFPVIIPLAWSCLCSVYLWLQLVRIYASLEGGRIDSVSAGLGGLAPWHPCFELLAHGVSSQCFLLIPHGFSRAHGYTRLNRSALVYMQSVATFHVCFIADVQYCDSHFIVLICNATRHAWSHVKQSLQYITWLLGLQKLFQTFPPHKGVSTYFLPLLLKM